MGKKMIIHSIWFAAVVAAFAVGSYQSEKRWARRASLNGGMDQAGTSDLIRLRAASAKEMADLDGDDVAANPIFGEATELDSSRSLSEDEINKLGEKFRTELDPVARRLAFAQLLEGLTVDNALLVREQIEHLSERSGEFLEFHYAWGAIAGQDSVLHGQDTEKKDMAATLAGWASADPYAAMKWFNEFAQNEDNNSQALLGGLIHGLANEDFGTATDFVFNLADSGNRKAEEMLRLISSKVLRTMSAEDAAAWAEDLPEGKLRASAMDRVAHDYVGDDPVAAATWAEQFVGTEHAARVIEEVGDEWAERDPVASINWLESLEDSDGKMMAFRSAVGEWVKRDPKAASEYILNIPRNAPERDPAIRGFVSRLVHEDPVSAITWAGEISDAGQRESTIVSAGRQYLRQDPAAAMEWLLGSGLPMEVQGRVLAPAKR
ncbi:MAG: hypothetical protein AAGJ79_03715 [Verrucomicrobiota bacterium]